MKNTCNLRFNAVFLVFLRVFLLTVLLVCADVSAAGSDLVSVDYSPASMRLPDYFVNNRVHLHTRLTLSWFDDPLFTEAEEHLANMGVKVYTRHCKSGEEGAWWPSSVGAIDPLTNGEDLAQQMIDRAHANDLRIIQYNRHIEDLNMAQLHPDWVCVNENGVPVPAPRGDYLCLNSPYRDFFTTRMLELLNRGADGFYFDSKHMPEDGCWCIYCRAKFTAETGLAPPTDHSYENPTYLRYLQFKNETIEAGMGHYVEQAHQVKPGFPMLVSGTFVPFLNEPTMRSKLTRLAPSPKTEYNMPISKSRVNKFFRDVTTDIPLPLWDVQWGFAFSYLRDAAQGRPAHVWINDTRSEAETLSSAAACITYGIIPNLDIDEADIPQTSMFDRALQIGERVGPYIGHTRPIRWAAIHFSERARNMYLSDTTAGMEPMYQNLLVPCWQSFRALNSIRAPIGVVTDDHLAENELAGYKVLILPRPEVLNTAEQLNVDAFEAAGGVVIELADDPRWYTAGQQEQIRQELLGNVSSQAGSSPISMIGGRQGVHAVAVKEPNDANQVIVCVTNEFTWLGFLQKHRLDGDYATDLPGTAPAPVTNAWVFVKGPTPKFVFDAVSQQRCATIPGGNGVWVVVPAFDHLACIVIDYEKYPIDYFWQPLAELAADWLDNNIELVPQPIVSRWEFEEGTGSDVNDSSANSFGGYMVNMDPCTAWVAGHGGGWALDFDGLDDHIVIGDSNQGNFRFTGDGITWSAWIKTSSTGSTMRVIMGISPDSMANESGTKMFMVDRGRLTLRGMNADLGGETTVTVNDGQWHHVAVTVKFDTYGEDDTLLFYIDANSDGGSIERNINRHSDAGFRITIGDGVWSAFDGLIDDVQVYNEALDANGILQIYEEGSFVPPEQLVCVKYLAKDLNEDCKVDFLDYAILVDNWLNIPALWP